MKLTDEQIEELIDKLQITESELEESAKSICSAEGAGQVWSGLNAVLSKLREVISDANSLHFNS